MPLQQNDIKLIQKYISGTLTTNELAEFEKRKSDNDFEEELNFQIGLKKSFIQQERNELRSQFKKWDHSESKKRVYMIRGWLYAASVLLIVGLGFIWYNTQRMERPEFLFQEYYEPFDNLLDPITKDADVAGTSISQGYELGQYQEVTQRNVSDPLQKFYQVLSLIEIGKVESAILGLQEFVDENTFRFHESAQWYLALCYLRSDQLLQARQILTAISKDPDHDYYRLAENLLKEF